MGARPAHAVDFGARWLGLILAVAAGAALRFDRLGIPSLWLDEILGYDLTTAATSRPWWSWFTGLEPEHGPLYYATQLAGRAFGDVELEARVIAAIFGTATIVLIWFATKEVAGATAAFVAAALLATAPLHVYYSREARPYALSMLLAAALLFAIVRAPRVVPWLIVATVYTSATALPLAVSGLVALIVARRSRQSLLAALPLLLALVLYRGNRPAWSDVGFPPLDAAFFDSLVRAFGVTATGSLERGNTAYVLFALAIAGAVILVRRRTAHVVILWLLPIVVALAALAITDHWYAVRYVAPALPPYFVLIGVAIDALIRAATRRVPWVVERWLTPAVAVVVAVVLAAQTIAPSRSEPHQKLNWRAIASTIWSHASVGDIVAAAEPWSTVSLKFYMDRLPTRVRLRPFATTHERAWFVTAGHSASSANRDALCLYPILLASELEGFRLHYAPSASDFLSQRAIPSEQNALRAAFGDSVTLTMGRENDPLMGTGWSAAEGKGADASRWAVGRSAELLLPAGFSRDETITLRVSPLSHPTLPAQTMTVRLNGHVLATVELADDWNNLSIDAPAAMWRSGANLIAFAFSRATAPRDLDPSLRDPRELAAMFDTIAIGTPSKSESSSFYVRLQDLVDADSAWLDHQTRLDPRQWDRARIDGLVGRLGFDPAITIPRLVAHEVALEDLLASSALLGSCEDAPTFVSRFWRVVFAKTPNAVEERVLLSILEKGSSRADFARRVARMSEFRAYLSGADDVE